MENNPIEELLLQQLPDEKVVSDLLKHLEANSIKSGLRNKIKESQKYASVITRIFYSDKYFLRYCRYRVQLALGEVKDGEMLEAEDGFVLLDYSHNKELLEVEFNTLAK